MSDTANNNSIVQLGPFPPAGSTLYFTMLPFQLAPGEVSWNVTARTEPEGKGATTMSLTGRDPISLAHLMFGLCDTFKLKKAQEFPSYAVAEQYTKAGLPNPHIHMDALTRNTPNWQEPRPIRYTPEGLEDFMGLVQSYLDGVAEGAAQAMVDQLPESMRVGPHPETGEYVAACGAKMYATGPKLDEPCISGGPCDKTASGRCWRWKGTEEVDATPAVTLEVPVAATAVMIDGTSEAVDEAPEEDVPLAAVATPEEAPEPPVEAAATPKKKAPATKRAAKKKASPKKPAATA